MNIQEKIEYHHKNKHCIHLERKKDRFKGSSCGFVLDYSEEFVLLHLVYDLKVEGYQIIPVYTINKIRFDQGDKFRDKILGWEKQKENVGSAHKIDLTSWVSVFRSIKKNGSFVTISGEALIKYDIPYHTLGPIKRIEKRKVVIHFISVDGYLVVPLDSIAYNDITIVEFNCHYLNMYKKYLQVKK